jgi:predicted amidohydrolase
MTEQSIHVACGQIVCRTGDIAGNLAQIETLSSEAAAAGARLCLFGEGAITGYALTDEVLSAAPTADGPVAQELSAIAARLGIWVVAGTMENAADGARHVSHFIAQPDGPLLVQRKHMLTARELDAGLVRGGEERLAFAVDGARAAVIICADSGMRGIHSRLAAQGCQLCLHPSAGGGARECMCHPEDLEDPDRLDAYVDLMEKVCFAGGVMRTAARHRMAIVTVNLAGDDGIDHYHPGHSILVDCRGRCVALLPGEYVVDYLRPQIVHGEVLLGEPRA